MNRIIALLVAAFVALSSLQGCYGKFALTRKIYAVNGEVKDKYLRSLVTWAFIIVPVYGVSALADFILFNTIEFWSGNNPIAAKEKDFYYVDNGDYYHVHALKRGDVVQYNIRHSGPAGHVDSLAIAWDLKSGNSTATLSETGRTIKFVATSDGSRVTVRQSAPDIAARVNTYAASYR